MEVEVLKQITGYGIFAILFFWQYCDSKKEYRQDKERAEQREGLLMEHIAKSDKSLERITEKQAEMTISQAEMTTTLSDIQQNQILMQRDIENLKSKVD